MELQHEDSMGGIRMKRILIGLLLIFLATSYIAQKEHVIKNLEDSITSRLSLIIVIETKEPKAHPPRAIEQLAYPPPEEAWPYIPPPTYTPYPTRTPRPLPTLAPTMNPWDD